MKYIVKRIIEPDYGCEERSDDYVAMDRVILRDEDGSEIEILCGLPAFTFPDEFMVG